MLWRLKTEFQIFGYFDSMQDLVEYKFVHLANFTSSRIQNRTHPEI